ncbi:acetyltransferase, GNAT family domain protein [Burkholderia pseudomallei MSHR3016]|nr:acetyltransferase, GNAT family domain protein [Burkholderia pseudomallei MSHR3016]
MRLFTAKARAAEAELSRATIDLDLPPGQFL